MGVRRVRGGAVAVLAMLVAGCVSSAVPQATQPLYLGADLSYVNEMEDCGAVFRKGGKAVDPFRLFAKEGANIVRVRIWNDAQWTRYSNLADVTKTIRRAKAAGMQVLLDFHYSDDWADGEKQIVPRAWEALGAEAQAEALYAYTRGVLGALEREGLMPEMVQVGNETNSELAGSKKGDPINWRRNAMLFNAGIRAVRDSGAASTISPKVMLHIAQPENVEGWFAAAEVAGVRDYDFIGISYYRKWSSMDVAGLGAVIGRLKARFDAEVIVVETSYPFTNDNADGAPNLLGPDTLIAGYPASPEGQLRYLRDLTQTVVDHGGVGVVYWEPAWVSTRCSTRWSQGSNWDNATFFDFRRGNEALPAFRFFRGKYRR
ncbi:MAG TPA: arabinogalactan endo-1,4-beta-galactosidase [Allosphingosinicella sp.]|jgi:arabinogalactan endo-1,4-beta-galactosidase